MVSQKDKQLWIDYSNAWLNYIGWRASIYKHADRLELIKYILKEHPHPTLGAVLELIDSLNVEQLKELLPELLSWGADDNPYLRWFQDKISSLPLDWLKSNIENLAEKYLILEHDETYVHYSAILQLYSKIDDDLTLKLAERGIAHSDKHVQEQGILWKNHILNKRNLDI